MSLQELKEVVKQASIIDIVSHYLSVQKKGTNYEAICPFHNDSKPSLKINADKGLFKCFACDTAGDSISFIQQHESIDFVEALKKAATILSIPLENYLTTYKKSPKKEMGFRVLRGAQNLYLQCSKSTNFKKLFQDFLTSRDLSVETSEKFGLGYAPGRSTLHKYLQSIPDQKDRAFAIKESLEIGVIRQNDRGIYDYFNNRITFPIWDHFGGIVGYGSRVLNSDQQPKYLNSKESYIFNKRNLLYAFHHAKKTIRQKNNVILVEGYMDAISLHQAGFTQTVAIMGIAISDQNAKELSRLTPNVFLALDTDDAGLKAMERVNLEFLKLGVTPKYLNFTPHKDPDDFVKAEGAKAFTELLQNAQNFIDYKLNSLKEGLDDNAAPEIKRQTLQEAFKTLAPLAMDIIATERIANFAIQIGLKTDSHTIIEHYQSSLTEEKSTRTVINKPSKQKIVAEHQEVPPHLEEIPLPSDNNELVDINPETSQNITQFGLGHTERNFLKLITQYPQLYEELNMTEVLDFLSQAEVKHYIERASEIYFECDENEYEKLLRVFVEEPNHPNELRQLIQGELFDNSPVSVDKRGLIKMIKDILRSLEIEHLQVSRRELIQKHELSKSNDDYNNSLREVSEIDKKINEVKSRK